MSEKLSFDGRFIFDTSGNAVAEFEMDASAAKYGPAMAAAPEMVELLKRIQLFVYRAEGASLPDRTEIDALLARVEGK